MPSLYRIEELTARRFEELVSQYPGTTVPIEQTPEWSTFESRVGRRPFGSYAYFRGAELVAIASFLHSTRPFRESMVVVNGPIWFADRNAAAEAALLQTIREQFRRNPAVHPVFVRLQVQHPAAGVVRALEQGWYDREIVVDLRPTEKELLASFRPNARQAIRKATKAGVEVRLVGHQDRAEVFARDLYPILAETSSRDDFAAFPARFYQTMLETLEPFTELLVAYLDGRPISWLITTEYRGYSVYYFAASSAAARKTFAPYLLLWESFRMLKERGNHSCGLTGIASDDWPQLANVTTFKRNFSKNEVALPPTRDVPLRPLRYRALALALRARRRGPALLRTVPVAARRLVQRGQ